MPAQVLVEGRTAEIFFREMVDRLSLRDRVQVRDYGDITSLTDYLKTFVQLPDFIRKVTGLGIIRDAENNPARAAFESVCYSLQSANIEPPEKIGEVQQKTRRVGVFILPDCQSPGMLETLCLASLVNNPRAAETLQCVAHYYDCLTKRGVPLPVNSTKARAWAFLAVQNLSDPQVGRAAQANIWPWDSNVFDSLKEFLKAL